MWIVVFLVIIVSPPFTYFFLGKYVDAKSYENRNIASKPTLTIDNYNTFSEKYEEYYNDNIPYRNQLITLNNSIDYYLFHQSSSDKVIIGNDGWLFYCNKDDSNPLDQSLGYWKFSDEKLEGIADNLEFTRRILENLGIEFVLFIAPNKETIYIDEVPDYYKVADIYTSTDQLIDYLKNNTNIRIVYPKDEDKIITIAPAIICDNSQYVSIFKKNEETDEITQYQVVELLENEIKIQVPVNENGEIYVYVFKDKGGSIIMEEVAIQY